MSVRTEFGLPLSMKPNFEDLSCEMIFGQMPSKFDEDPTYAQPCFLSKCSLAPSQLLPCPKVDTDRRDAAVATLKMQRSSAPLAPPVPQDRTQQEIWNMLV